MSEPSEEQTPKFYTPKQVAEMFGITPNALKHRRLRGQIEGIAINENTVVYTEDQIRKANFSPKKRGPQPKKTQAREQVEENEVAWARAC